MVRSGVPAPPWRARPRGETREVQATLGSAVEDPELRGATIGVKVLVNDLKKLRLPELNNEFFDSMGFNDLAELRGAIAEMLKRKIHSEQRQAMHRQVVDQLLRQTPFDLPTDLVAREERSTIQRLVAQFRQEGKSDREIRANEAQIRANAHETTLRSLKELLLLSRIADAEKIEVSEQDAALEIEAIAARTDESARRVARSSRKGGRA